jgi:hypothetical protein
MRPIRRQSEDGRHVDRALSHLRSSGPGGSLAQAGLPPESDASARRRGHHRGALSAPFMGAKKLLWILHTRHPSWSLPGRSMVCDILRRHGLVPKKRHQRHIGYPGKPTRLIAAPNDVWSADCKGQFRTGDGVYCYPLTVADGYSRFLLGCQALSSTRLKFQYKRRP